LVAAGLPTDIFTFIGFLTPKSGARRKRLETFAAYPGSLVAFVPPHKLVATLEDAAAVGFNRCFPVRHRHAVETLIS
jgi:16S rRNA (cytidine1402-2'-O)-methyltransferase